MEEQGLLIVTRRFSSVILWCVMAASVSLSGGVSAQTPQLTTTRTPSAPEAPAPNDPVTIFPQHQWNRFWFSGQMNIIEQMHGDFRALYSGPNSLRNTAEHAA